MVLANM